ncbi:MAG: aminotransferase class V-fold PLP-dependent enzyme [Minicystis sp.]
MTVDWRSEWFEVSDATYLNFAAHGLLPRVAAQAVERAMEAKARPHRGEDASFFESASRARARMASLLGASGDDIALVTGAGAGAATLASAIDWRPGDEVVLARGDFPVQLATWQPLEARHGVRVRIAEPRGPFVCADDLAAALTPRTRVVSVSHVRFDDGSLLEVEPLAAACRARGVVLVLDVSQSCGALPIDVGRLGADVLIGAGYKYLLGPWGTGFLWMRRELLDALPPSPFNWIAQGVDRFSALSYSDPRPAGGAMRFDAAEYASPYNFNLAAMAAALELVVRASPSIVLAHARTLVDRLFAGLPAPCVPASPLPAAARGSFGCFTAGSWQASAALFDRLRREGVIVAFREGRIRVAPHLYNSADDIDRLLAVVREWTKEQGG